MTRQSAGLLVFRRSGSERTLQLLLAHPGGPFFARRDLGVWTVPKGEYDADESPGAAAEREFAEEIGLVPPEGSRVDLGEVRQSSGKRVRVFAVEGELDLANAMSNLFEMEWPVGSGKMESFPEVDRAEWFDADEARRRLNPSQAEFVDRLIAHLAG
ncbi:MAG: NUDIX domain-containing protein [Acidimicrobiales bacterium]